MEFTESFVSLFTDIVTAIRSINDRWKSSSTKITGTSVLNASVVICTANPDRKGFIIFNNSANSVYVTFGATSVASTCTRLIPTYASWEMTGGVVYTGVISAVRNGAATGVVTVYELI